MEEAPTKLVLYIYVYIQVSVFSNICVSLIFSCLCLAIQIYTASYVLIGRVAKDER